MVCRRTSRSPDATQVWVTVIPYLTMALGFLYLVPVIRWHIRYMVDWRQSNTLEAGFCPVALARGKAEVFNTAQGTKFTSLEFTQVLPEDGVKISVGRKGRYTDRIFMERL